MDDIDLSHLLPDVQVPADGATRARQTAVRRRHRRQALGSTAAVLLVVGVGIGALISANQPKEVVLQRDAGFTTTTFLETTTTVAPDPRTTYVGLEHTSTGSGLPVDVTIQRGGVTDPTTAKRGNFVSYWMRDKAGDMIWVEHITDVNSKTGTVTSKVAAIFAAPDLADSQDACVGTCYRPSTHKADSTLVAVADGDKIISAWKLDYTNLTLTATSLKDISLYPPAETPVTTPPPADPARPALYGVVATATNQDDLLWYNANEQVISGGGTTYGSDFLNSLHDRKANVEVIVWQQNTVVRDVLVTPMSGGLPLPVNNYLYSYRGQPQNTIIAILDGDKMTKAWILDSNTHKFVPVNVADITKTPPAK